MFPQRYEPARGACVAVLILGAALTVGAAAPVDTAPPPALTVLYSAGLGGYLQPCGCDDGQAGGLAGWAAIADSVRASGGESLTIARGPLTDTAVRLPYVLRAYAETGLDLLVAEPADVALGVLEAAGQHDFRLLALPGDDAGAAASEVRAGGWVVRVGHMPADREFPACPGGADLHVLVASEDALDAATDVPLAAGYDAPVLVLGPPAGRRAPVSAQADGVTYVEGAAHAEYCVAVRYAATEGRLARAEIVAEPVTDATPPHPVVQRVAEEYYRHEQVLLGESGPQPVPVDPDAPLAERGVALAADCRACHPEAYETWLASPHAHALETLAGAGRLVAECASCHSQAYRETERLPDPALPSEEQGVTCMTCHGAGVTHALTGLRECIQTDSARDACATCHRPPHQTEPFDWESQSRRVRHWGDGATE